jgi:hypothetical protein
MCKIQIKQLKELVSSLKNTIKTQTTKLDAVYANRMSSLLPSLVKSLLRKV